jgi:hypothetical protein
VISVSRQPPRAKTSFEFLGFECHWGKNRAGKDHLNRQTSRTKLRYEIILAPEAVEDLRRMRANLRSAVRAALETHWRYTPTKTSKSRTKRLGFSLGHNFACVSVNCESFMT